jgi:NADPH:quinone reductase-like Zn-dependent oxidoreductase
MKALIFRETGEPNGVLKLAEIPTPPLAAGEALVRMLLSPIHPSDLHMLRGRYGYQPELPASPGIEGVGIVDALGPNVQGPAVGTRVVFVHVWQTWREQIVCSVDRLVPVPNGLDDPAAATCCINPLTAWALTKSSHNLKEGDWLLQTVAASSVGKFVLQFGAAVSIQDNQRHSRARAGNDHTQPRRQRRDLHRWQGPRGTPGGIDRGQGR